MNALSEYLASLDDNMRACRVGRHWWPDWEDAGSRWYKSRVTQAMWVEMSCQRNCGVLRIEFVRPDGTIEAVRMDYTDAKGYLFTKTANLPPGTRVVSEIRLALREEMSGNIGKRLQWVD